jgi:hypothetical protein
LGQKERKIERKKIREKERENERVREGTETKKRNTIKVR